MKDSEIAEMIRLELKELLDGFDVSILDISEIDQINQTIKVQFRYNVIPEDEYIGLLSY